MDSTNLQRVTPGDSIKADVMNKIINATNNIDSLIETVPGTKKLGDCEFYIRNTGQTAIMYGQPFVYALQQYRTTRYREPHTLMLHGRLAQAVQKDYVTTDNTDRECPYGLGVARELIAPNKVGIGYLPGAFMASVYTPTHGNKFYARLDSCRAGFIESEFGPYQITARSSWYDDNKNSYCLLTPSPSRIYYGIVSGVKSYYPDNRYVYSFNEYFYIVSIKGENCYCDCFMYAGQKQSNIHMPRLDVGTRVTVAYDATYLRYTIIAIDYFSLTHME